MSGYPWPVPKERPMSGDAVNPEDLNDAARQVLDAPGNIGEHMLSSTLLTDLARPANYAAGLAQGVLYRSTDLLDDLDDFNSAGTAPAAAVKLYPGRGWQLVEEWEFSLPHTADVVADGNVQLTGDTPIGTFPTLSADLANLGQASVVLALDGLVCPDFADYGPDKSAEDYQMTQAQGTHLWGAQGHGIWTDVPPGVHKISIRVGVEQGHHFPHLTQPMWAWSRSVIAKALYK